ncbi:hypothetical protein NDU88_004529 [Pleurodeles waltl]|uniref:Uncharacterized protein n=1 Tax=Pleurodeles waltl TaxID=8319 RepID=A0AAV7M827_PLEWA|nr:hypothetical protein NDU88_004529 [Pleurodeles waltl]
MSALTVAPWPRARAAVAQLMKTAAAYGRAAGEAAARFKGRSICRCPFLRPQVPWQARQDRRPRIGSRSLPRSVQKIS